MKQVFFTLTILILSYGLQGQTKILDSHVDFNVSPATLTLYLTDSLVTNVSVKVGDSFGASNTINSSEPINSETISDNLLIVELSSLSSGEYFFEVIITSENESTQMIQFKTD